MTKSADDWAEALIRELKDKADLIERKKRSNAGFNAAIKDAEKHIRDILREAETGQKRFEEES